MDRNPGGEHSGSTLAPYLTEALTGWERQPELPRLSLHVALGQDLSMTGVARLLTCDFISPEAGGDAPLSAVNPAARKPITGPRHVHSRQPPRLSAAGVAASEPLIVWETARPFFISFCGFWVLSPASSLP